MKDTCRCGHLHTNPGPCRSIRRGVRCPCPERVEWPATFEEWATSPAMGTPPAAEQVPVSDYLARPGRRRISVSTLATIAAMFGTYHERPER